MDVSLSFTTFKEHIPRPIWKRTFTPIARTQSTIRKAKIRGIEFIYRLKNQGREATEIWTSTDLKCSWIMGRHR